MAEHVVIIGRPNVGKSTLYNRLIGRRKALVHHEPGTTRDRNETVVSWKQKEFIVVDTGGWEDKNSIFSPLIREQMQKGLEHAALVVFMVDGKTGYHPLDGEIAKFLRREHKRVILVVNKIDSAKDEAKAADFYRLGFEDVITISGVHGLNINELLDQVADRVADTQKTETPEDEAIRVILVGKPNVGKSSLLNKLCNEERVIVNEQPGTTREAVDILLHRGERDFILVDTPGLHRKRKFTDDMEYLMALSARNAMERSDVAVLLMDLDQGIGDTEAAVAELALRNHKACLLVVNKWDIVEDREVAVKRVRKLIEEKLPFLSWARLIFISAKTGQRVDRLLDEVAEVYAEFSRRVPADELKDVINRAAYRNPLSRKGRQLKIMDVEQTGVRAPYFVFTVNSTELAHFSYRRYLENVLREHFGFSSTPLVMRFKKAGGRKRKKKA